MLSIIGLLFLACEDTTKESVTECEEKLWYDDQDMDGFGNPYFSTTSCIQPETGADNSNDCNDSNAEEFPGAIWYRDIDGDGFGDPEQALEACLTPVGYVKDSTDCDDLDGTRNPENDWYLDSDDDNFGDSNSPIASCEADETASPNSGDCNDQDWLIHPEANEICDDIDNDCDDIIDDEDPDIDIYTQVPLFEDIDGDGFGSDILVGQGCPNSSLGSPVSNDCDDSNAEIYPDRLDYLDDIDSDCDGISDKHIISSALKYWTSDVSSSGFGAFLETKDLDGDGKREILVGTHALNSNSGGAKLIAGNADMDQVGFPSEGLSWEGITEGDNAGVTLGFAGDFNGDGTEDLIISAYNHDGNTGKAFVISSDMPSGSLADAILIVGNNTVDSYFGRSFIALGDLNSDGMDEILISANKDDRQGNNRGSITIIQGGDTTPILLEDVGLFGESNGDNFGYHMADMGDPDGDGITNYGVGAPFCDDGPTNAGCMYLFSRSDFLNGLPETLDGIHRFWGTQESEYMGYQIANAGDFDGDGLDDMLFGSANYDAIEDDEGAAYLMLGSNSDFENSLEHSHLLMLGAEANDYTGRHMKGLEDIDGDGKADIAIVSHTSDNHRNNSGVVYGVLGGREAGTFFLAEDADFKIVAESSNDYIGRGIAPAGDINQDGFSDFWIGASGASSFGKIYLMGGVGSPF